MATLTVPNLLSLGYMFSPKGRELIEYYLVPKALRTGELPGDIAEGVDIFSAHPRALPFQPNHRRERGEVWGYFLAAQPAGETCPAPGECWVRYGPEKAYYSGGGAEAVAFRRRFAFRITWHGGAIWSPTRWLMKEYRLNKGAAAFRGAQPDPEPDMDVVVRKVFKKPVAAARSRCPSDCSCCGYGVHEQE